MNRQRGSHAIWYSPNGHRISIQNKNGEAKGYQVKQFLDQYDNVRLPIVIFLEVDINQYFHYSGNMETSVALIALSALAQESRLAIFRLLVQAKSHLTAGEIKGKTGLPGSSLSFHLKELTNAGLINARQESRFIYYSANYDAMRKLVNFLTENCCGGKSC